MSRARTLCGVVVLVAALSASRFVKLAVVAGDSMVPSIRRGDVCVVARFGDVCEGDVILYREPGARRAVLHRVSAVHTDGSLTTRGDGNVVPDRERVARSEVVGRVVRVVPLGGILRLESGERDAKLQNQSDTGH
ncbi:MAG: signal peptidase I [Coriobacteriia bacterium]|nr:signal peptidase I [Coriobacteriia bacterium]